MPVDTHQYDPWMFHSLIKLTILSGVHDELAHTFALAMLMLAVAAAGTMMMGIMPRTSFLSLPLCGPGPCFELLYGSLHSKFLVCELAMFTCAALFLARASKKGDVLMTPQCLQHHMG